MAFGPQHCLEHKIKQYGKALSLSTFRKAANIFLWMTVAYTLAHNLSLQCPLKPSFPFEFASLQYPDALVEATLDNSDSVNDSEPPPKKKHEKID